MKIDEKVKLVECKNGNNTKRYIIIVEHTNDTKWECWVQMKSEGDTRDVKKLVQNILQFLSVSPPENHEEVYM